MNVGKAVVVVVIGEDLDMAVDVVTVGGTGAVRIR